MVTAIFNRKDHPKESHAAMGGFSLLLIHCYQDDFEACVESSYWQSRQLQLSNREELLPSLSEPTLREYGLWFPYGSCLHKVFCRTCTRRPSRLQQSNRHRLYGFICTWLPVPYSLAFQRYLEHFQASKLLQFRSLWSSSNLLHRLPSFQAWYLYG